jgi:uncharacterized lipoprotein NlpE involved in copper resistance
MKKFFYFFGILALVSCNQSAISEEDSNLELTLFGAESVFEPGTYKGEFACADCPGITTILQFEGNGKVVVSRYYNERSEEPEISFGQWSEEHGSVMVVSYWNDDTLFFKSHTKGLVLLDKKRNYVHADYQLATQSTERIDLSKPFMVLGRFFYMADAAVMWLEPNEQPLPVVMNEPYIALEKSFLLFGEQERDCVLSRLVCRIVQAPDMEGQIRSHLDVVRLVHVKSGGCKAD